MKGRSAKDKKYVSQDVLTECKLSVAVMKHLDAILETLVHLKAVKSLLRSGPGKGRPTCLQ